MRPSAIWCGAASAVLITLSHPAPAPAAGAIAIGRCDRLGWGYNFDSMGAARAEALSRCGASCSVIVTFRHACGAVAISSDCAARGWAWAGTRGGAERRALDECNSRGGNGCTIRRWVCDGGP